MATLKDWLNQKFVEWEKNQGHKQSYYAFARYLEVSQSALSQWMMGSSQPDGEDLPVIAKKLGPEIYEIMGLSRPGAEKQQQMVSAVHLPPDIRQHLANAINEADQALRQARIQSDTAEARRITLEILAKWGFIYKG